VIAGDLVELTSPIGQYPTGLKVRVVQHRRFNDGFVGCNAHDGHFIGNHTPEGQRGDRDTRYSIELEEARKRSNQMRVVG
jgi:hypothetical protein